MEMFNFFFKLMNADLRVGIITNPENCQSATEDVQKNPN